MARGRMLNTSISVDEDVAELIRSPGVGLAGGLFFTWLIAHLDAAGKQTGNLVALRGMVAPLVPEITEAVIEATLTRASGLGLVLWYTHERKSVVMYPKFSKNQTGLRPDKEAKSLYPDPTPEQRRSNSGAESGVTPGEWNGKEEKGKEEKRTETAATEPPRPSPPTQSQSTTIGRLAGDGRERTLTAGQVSQAAEALFPGDATRCVVGLTAVGEPFSPLEVKMALEKAKTKRRCGGSLFAILVGEAREAIDKAEGLKPKPGSEHERASREESWRKKKNGGAGPPEAGATNGARRKVAEVIGDAAHEERRDETVEEVREIMRKAGLIDAGQTETQPGSPETAPGRGPVDSASRRAVGD